MEIGVSEAAERLSVSPQRVRQLLESGQLSGRKLADSWVLDESQLRRRPAVSRPLSARMAWGLIDHLSDRRLGFSDGLSAHERYRVRQLADRLQASDNPVLLLRSWLPRRAQRVELSCASRDLDDLAGDVQHDLCGVLTQIGSLALFLKADQTHVVIAVIPVQVIAR